MEKLVDLKLKLGSLVLYAMAAVKCVMVWDGGDGAAKLGAILPGLLALPVINSVVLWLIGKFQDKLIIDADGTPALRRVLYITFGLFVYIYALMLFMPPEVKLHLRCTICGVGVFMVLLGLAMPKLPRNRLVGMRYSWTLTDPAVWKKSNVAGGVYTVLIGLALIVSGAIPQQRTSGPFTTLEVGAFVVYIMAMTLHSRIIALKAGIGRPE